jgi:hypothetical protein
VVEKYDRRTTVALHLAEHYARPFPASCTDWAVSLLEGAYRRTGEEWAQWVRVPDVVVAAKAKLPGTIPGLVSGHFVISIGDAFTAMGLWPYIKLWPHGEDGFTSCGGSCCDGFRSGERMDA